jgi:tungstate transport system substrate-binding protein
MNNKLIAAIIVIIIGLIAIGAYTVNGGFQEKQILRVSTTTSLEDTGLLDTLETAFEKEHSNIDVQFISAGTGIAIKYAEKGDADMVIVHDKKKEKEFIDQGYGTKRYPFAYNYFYIVGPTNDPANIKGMNNATQVFEKIIQAGQINSSVKFASRGDSSGTNSRELKIWNNTGANYNSSINGSSWYIETGKGMGDTLTIANEKSAYTLSDSGTYLAFKGNITLVPYLTTGKDLLNVYSAIAVNPDKINGVNYNASMEFVDFLLSTEGQQLIGNYGKEKYGQTLFTPLYGKSEPS